MTRWHYTILIHLAAITSIAIIAICISIPESFGLIRLALILTSLYLACYVIYVARILYLRLLIGSLFLLTVVVAIWNKDSVLVPSDQYAIALKSYTGTPYVWGGESDKGIDCSGLLRRAYIYACINVFRGSGNLGYLANAFDVWLNDSSAINLLEGYSGRTEKINDVSSINEISGIDLRIGDLAVTANGIHCLAYVGNNEWISADPGVKSVIILKAPDRSFGFYKCKVAICRWKNLHF